MIVYLVFLHYSQWMWKNVKFTFIIKILWIQLFSDFIIQNGDLIWRKKSPFFYKNSDRVVVLCLCLLNRKYCFHEIFVKKCVRVNSGNFYTAFQPPPNLYIWWNCSLTFEPFIQYCWSHEHSQSNQIHLSDRFLLLKRL